MAERTQGPRFYTTSKTPKQLLGEMISLLSEYGADSIHIQQKLKEPFAIAFLIAGVPYQLTPSVEGVAKRLGEMGARAKASPEAIAWAQSRALLELQLEAIENGIAPAETILGGYALTSTGRTVGDMIAERKGELMPGESLLLPKGTAK
jgi:hypothetical protein